MASTTVAPHPTIRQQNSTTFSRDLEFLSSLSNPFYLHSLAVQGHLSSAPFLLYLQHLHYFRHPRYVKYLQYPQALTMLDLLQHREFREALKDQAWAGEVAARMVRHWAAWRNTDTDDTDLDHEDPSLGGTESRTVASASAAVDGAQAAQPAPTSVPQPATDPLQPTKQEV